MSFVLAVIALVLGILGLVGAVSGTPWLWAAIGLLAAALLVDGAGPVITLRNPFRHRPPS